MTTSSTGSSPRLLRTALAISLSAAVFGTTAPASAQSSQALAEKLFIDGRRLMSEGKYDQACPKLQESQRLDPGGGTAINLAMCYEAQGKDASAWAMFKEALAFATKDGRTSRAEMAREHIAKLEPNLHQIVIVVPETPPHAAGLKVQLDGVDLGEAGWGMQSPIDPGKHTIKATAPDYRDWQKEVEVGANKDVLRVEVPALVEIPLEERANTKIIVRGDEGPKLSPGRRTAAYISLGVGVAGIATGAVFGLLMLKRDSDSSSYCKDNNYHYCDQTGVDLNKDAWTYSWISTGAFGVGLVGAAVGSYLLLVRPAAAGAPPKKQARASTLPSVHVDGRGGGGISLTQVW